MTLADPTTHTTALVALLEAADLVVGDCAPPTVPYGRQNSSRFIPYCVVYQYGQSFDGSLGCPDDDSDLEWQVTCVADTRAACDTLRHQVNTALIGQSLTVSGRTVPRIRANGGAYTHRERAESPSQVTNFVAMPRFAAYSTH